MQVPETVRVVKPETITLSTPPPVPGSLLTGIPTNCQRYSGPITRSRISGLSSHIPPVNVEQVEQMYLQATGNNISTKRQSYNQSVSARNENEEHTTSSQRANRFTALREVNNCSQSTITSRCRKRRNSGRGSNDDVEMLSNSGWSIWDGLPCTGTEGQLTLSRDLVGSTKPAMNLTPEQLKENCALTG